MLVLSRRENEKLLFPNLGITVEILRIRGNTVRVGVEAPAGVRVVRQEIHDQPPPARKGVAAVEGPPPVRHELRNRLNIAGLALHLAQRLIDAGRTDDAEKALQKAIAEMESLDQLVAQKFAGPGTIPEAPPRKVRRALIVEDNANERELLAGFLRMHGFEVDGVEDGVSAMDYLAGHRRPDVVLLDMRIPRLNGPKTLSAIRRNPALQDMKVFAVSGSDRQEFPVPIGPRGVDRWIAKPINPQKLVEELNRDLNGSCMGGDVTSLLER